MVRQLQYSIHDYQQEGQRVDARLVVGLVGGMGAGHQRSHRFHVALNLLDRKGTDLLDCDK
jgi:hypothetical protein